MQATRIKRFLVATVTGAVTAAGFVAVPSAVWAASIQLAPAAPLRQADVAGSVDYLTSTFGVTVAEAMRRLELQRVAGELQDVLAREHPETYAGSWIDQENGGILMIGSTKPTSYTALLRAIPDNQHIRVVAAEHSRKQLEAVAARVSARLGLSVAQAPVIDDQRNRVVLHNKAATAAHSTNGLTSLGSDASKVAVVLPEAKRVPAACTIQNCTPPMRGGLKLYIFNSLNSRPNWLWSCTNGFNVHGSNGWQYTVTAGHCFEGEGNFSDHNGKWVGSYQASTLAGFFENYPADGMIAPYVVTGGVNYSSYWVGAPLVGNRVWNTRSSSTFPIKGSYTYAQIGVGWVACATGATSLSTRCGSVKAKDGGIVTNICSQQGDSGGPLFSEVDNKAYGVLSWITTGGCVAGAESGFSPLSVLFSTVQAKSGISFAVNTA